MGREVAQFENSRAALAVGDARFGAVRYSGTMYVFDEDDNDVVGIVFYYQNNKNFYLLSATETGSNQVSQQGFFSLSTNLYPGLLEDNQNTI
jgi:hypothetical protein